MKPKKTRTKRLLTVREQFRGYLHSIVIEARKRGEHHSMVRDHFAARRDAIDRGERVQVQLFEVLDYLPVMERQRVRSLPTHEHGQAMCEPYWLEPDGTMTHAGQNR